MPFFRDKPTKNVINNGLIFASGQGKIKQYIAKQKRIEKRLIQHAIRWKYNPSAAPHLSGV